MNEEDKRCPSCGHPVAPEHLFCRHCGTDVGLAELDSEEIIRLDIDEGALRPADKSEAEPAPLFPGPQPGASSPSGTPHLPGEERWSPSTRLLFTIALVMLFLPVFVKIFFLIKARFNEKEYEKRQRICIQSMRKFEGAIDMWEMDHDAAVFGGGHDCELSSYAMWGQALVPNYIEKFPGCPLGGNYRYHYRTHTVWCTRHNTVATPEKGTHVATGP